MFRHVALFAWQPGTPRQQVEKFAAGLRTLPEAIPELRSYQVGIDAGVTPDNYEFAVVADFDSVHDYLVYRDHPAHAAVVAPHARMLARRVAVQYEI